MYKTRLEVTKSHKGLKRYLLCLFPKLKEEFCIFFFSNILTAEISYLIITLNNVDSSAFISFSVVKLSPQ